MNGILVVDKPAGFTSFDVVAKLRGICGTRKIGHGGTLDPMATGVLPVFVGPAAKAVDLAPNQGKAYEALVRFGLKTDTGDITGRVLETGEAKVKPEDLQAVLPRFLGRQMQTPPMYSAVKVKGRPLYDYARAGREVERKAREVEIFELAASPTRRPEDFALAVACGKGTYVRSLVEDIGAALGLPATLAALRRTRSGVFTLAGAHTLDEIQAAKDAGALPGLFVAVDSLFMELPEAAVDAAGEARLRNGAPVYRSLGRPGLCRVYAAGAFLGLGRLDAEGSLRAEKLFV